MQLCIDGVHYRECAIIGPINLKVVQNECCLGRWIVFMRELSMRPTSASTFIEGALESSMTTIRVDKPCAGIVKRSLLGSA